ncbi:MAG: SDR family NAD(P)-dependent oxidoreductase [Thermoleophilia bacterium]|nr:SDR family NAD(P)-dependent oxidoreductase [Thermoleophilia bacterium]
MEGKVAIVTGASRGIGKAIAIGLAKEGAKVVVAARTVEPRSEKLPGTIHETVDAIEALGGEALAVQCDVTDEASVSAMVQAAVDRFGRIDVLVNNAAVDFPASVLDMPLKRWDLVIRVNTTGPFLCSKAVLPHMIAQGGGSIVNITSNAGAERGSGTVGYSAAYGVSKAALDRFTWALAAEVGKYNIAVNAVKPWGVVDTEGMRLWVPEEERVGWKSPASMVACAIFLAKQDASGVTGCVAFDDEYICWHGLKVEEG